MKLAELRKAREQAMQAQLDSDWIKIEQLRSMTVAELGSFLAEDCTNKMFPYTDAPSVWVRRSEYEKVCRALQNILDDNGLNSENAEHAREALKINAEGQAEPSAQLCSPAVTVGSQQNANPCAQSQPQSGEHHSQSKSRLKRLAIQSTGTQATPGDTLNVPAPDTPALPVDCPQCDLPPVIASVEPTTNMGGGMGMRVATTVTEPTDRRKVTEDSRDIAGNWCCTHEQKLRAAEQLAEENRERFEVVSEALKAAEQEAHSAEERAIANLGRAVKAEQERDEYKGRVMAYREDVPSMIKERDAALHRCSPEYIRERLLQTPLQSAPTEVFESVIAALCGEGK